MEIATNMPGDDGTGVIVITEEVLVVELSMPKQCEIHPILVDSINKIASGIESFHSSFNNTTR